MKQEPLSLTAFWENTTRRSHASEAAVRMP
jgi:hypothetical protein